MTQGARLSPIDRFLPAWQVHLLSGPPGGGKTTLAAGMAAAFVQRQPVFGKPVSALPWVGTLIADREASDTRRWYAAAGYPDIPFYSLLDDFTQSLDQIRTAGRARQLLQDILDTLAIPPNGLLILDPISPWAGGDMNKYHVVYPAMIELGRMCLQRQITMLGLAHTGKQRADRRENYQRPQDRILGSTALLGCSGTQMALVPPDDPTRDPHTFTWVPHHAAQEAYHVTRDPKTGLFAAATPIDAVRPAKPAGRPSQDTRRALLLAQIPTTHAVSAPTLLDYAHSARAQVSRAQLYRWLNQWLADGRLHQPSPGQYQRTQLAS